MGAGSTLQTDLYGPPAKLTRPRRTCLNLSPFFYKQTTTLIEKQLHCSQLLFDINQQIHNQCSLAHSRMMFPIQIHFEKCTLIKASCCNQTSRSLGPPHRSERNLEHHCMILKSTFGLISTLSREGN